MAEKQRQEKIMKQQQSSNNGYGYGNNSYNTNNQTTQQADPFSSFSNTQNQLGYSSQSNQNQPQDDGFLDFDSNFNADLSNPFS